MKVGFVDLGGSFGGEVSGAELARIELAQILLKNGFGVEYMVATTGQLYAQLRQDRIPVRVLPELYIENRPKRSEPFKAVFVSLHSYLAWRRAVSKINQLGINLLVPNENLSRVMIALLKRSLNSKILTFVNEEFGTSLAETLYKNFLLSRFDGLVAVSKAVESQLGWHLNQKYKNKVKQFYPGVDSAGRTSHLSKQDARKYIFADLSREDRGEKVLCFVGQLEPRKGVANLLDALEILRDDNIITLIAGEGRMKSEIQDAIVDKGLSNNVILLGTRPNAPDLMKGSDIVVIPSLSEAFGRTAVEALLNETVPVSSRVGGLFEIMIGLDQFTFKAGDSSELAATIARALDMDRQKIALQLRTRGLDFTVSQSAEFIMDFMLEVSGEIKNRAIRL